MPKREASCSCGQLRLTSDGEPVRVSVCHCLNCQQRTGSAFSYNAQFPRSQIVAIEGRDSNFVRAGDSGNPSTFHFCPVCGTTVYWEPAALPDRIYVAVGAYADPNFPPPRHSVYEERKHAWVNVPGEVEHLE